VKRQGNKDSKFSIISWESGGHNYEERTSIMTRVVEGN
jgi:hypothetical protein